MKTHILFSALLLVAATYVNAQKRAELSIPTETIRVVAIRTSSATTICSSSAHAVHLASQLTQKGRVTGFQWPDKRPEFSIQHSVKGDTLFVTTPEIFSPSTIGVNTYSEVIENTIAIPKSKEVIIESANRLYFADYFPTLCVLNADHVAGIDIPRDSISHLECVARDELQFNGQNKAAAFELVSTGNLTVKVNAHTIHLNIY